MIGYYFVEYRRVAHCLQEREKAPWLSLKNDRLLFCWIWKLHSACKKEREGSLTESKEW